MERNISYTFWGENINSSWFDWYMDVNEMFKNIGLNISHIGIKSNSFTSGKILTAIHKENSIIKKLKEGEIPLCMECYSLPDDFKIASFDYNALCVRTNAFISVVLRERFIFQIEEKKIIQMKKYLKPMFCEEYSTLINEVPLLYAYTKNSENLKSYCFIKTI